jgi:hypothetical protein
MLSKVFLNSPVAARLSQLIFLKNKADLDLKTVLDVLAR